jgi:hypothetical protein
MGPRAPRDSRARVPPPSGRSRPPLRPPEPSPVCLTPQVTNGSNVCMVQKEKQPEWFNNSKVRHDRGSGRRTLGGGTGVG